MRTTRCLRICTLTMIITIRKNKITSCLRNRINSSILLLLLEITNFQSLIIRIKTQIQILHITITTEFNPRRNIIFYVINSLPRPVIFRSINENTIWMILINNTLGITFETNFHIAGRLFTPIQHSSSQIPTTLINTIRPVTTNSFCSCRMRNNIILASRERPQIITRLPITIATPPGTIFTQANIRLTKIQNLCKITLFF